MLFLLACTPPAEQTTTPATTADLSIANLEVSECTSDSGDVESLSVSPSDNSLVVAHIGYAAECCLSFNVLVSQEAATILATYEPIGDPCDCMCHYDFGYRVEGVTAGDWTFQAGMSEESVHVE